MAMTDVLNADDIEKAMEAVAAPGSFDYKKFFQMTRIDKEEQEAIITVFNLLDTNRDTFLDRSELKFLLRRFGPYARILEDREVDILLRGADKDGDGKISFAEFVAML